MSDIEALRSTVERINLIAALDSSGRGGNLFFLTLFDLHPEVACCPIVQYTYSYVLAEFGDGQHSIDAEVARRFVAEKSYFRLVYNDLNDANEVLFSRMGGTPEAQLDRARLRNLIDDYFAAREKVSRREIIAIPLLAYALVRGTDMNSLRYLLIGDAVSRRAEEVVDGFSGAIVDEILRDFPQAKIFRLVRDPRATFASPRHQFVNSLGNMYAIRPGNYWSRLATLNSMRLTPDNGCVYLYWLFYLRQTERAICAKEAQYPDNFMIAKNEDLNLHFPEAMIAIGEWLGVRHLDSWRTSDFVPTVIGVPWHGAGAYNSRYQRATTGLLANDPEEVSRNVTGPNEYVTRRWRTRLNPREIELIEFLFFDDLKRYGYEILHHDPRRSPKEVLDRTLSGPFEGEWPKLSWLRAGFSAGMGEGWRRLFYTLTFLPFYVLSRLKLRESVLKRRFFGA
ncbi:hypothetical protein [Rhodoferax saidenbachensis]|uniref:Uncharacterized protein n=1 Tax=Rhodoferax saidenbachensis TaxID=1484693 RepID=A0ABU1ZM48_9BURK|nr:hypothetical protein [Rhodoferax saidenbachensis]MDR7306041.1 hypothetical protein [Rhodoferax saidenbachensis]